MLQNNRRNKTINSHLEVFRTYKELKNLLPFGYIKTKVSESQKYSFSDQPILINIEKEKEKIETPTKITNNLFHNKNIYIFSDENENFKKLMSKFKEFNSYYKLNKIHSIKSENNFDKSSKLKNSSISENLRNSNNMININNYILNSKTINYRNNIKSNLKELSEDELDNMSKRDSDLISNNSKNIVSLSGNDFELNRNKHKINFKNSSINNCIMKNNIYLPSITSRLKKSLPRYQRQNKGFLLNGLGKEYLKELNSLSNNNDDEKNGKRNHNNIIFKYKTDTGPEYIGNSEDKKSNKINFVLNSIKRNKNRYKKEIKQFDTIEITRITKIIKRNEC
jgi:hypothetical protein